MRANQTSGAWRRETTERSADVRSVSSDANSVRVPNPYLRLRPQTGDQAWVQYDFDGPQKVSPLSVFWEADKQYCWLPKG